MPKSSPVATTEKTKSFEWHVKTKYIKLDETSIGARRAKDDHLCGDYNELARAYLVDDTFKMWCKNFSLDVCAPMDDSVDKTAYGIFKDKHSNYIYAPVYYNYVLTKPTDKNCLEREAEEVGFAGSFKVIKINTESSQNKLVKIDKSKIEMTAKNSINIGSTNQGSNDFIRIVDQFKDLMAVHENSKDEEVKAMVRRFVEKGFL